MRHSVLLVGTAVMVNAANARCILKQLQFLKQPNAKCATLFYKPDTAVDSLTV